MSRIRILTAKEIDAMRKVGRLAGELLVLVGEHIRPGVTTEEINKLVAEATKAAGGKSAPLGYRGFPKSVCTSVNHVVCHGIPGPVTLKDGDIINVDVTPLLPEKNGWHGDSSITFYVGEPSAIAKHVTEVARRCLEIGIEQVRPGAAVGDIGAAIMAYAHSKGCSVVRSYTGHGIHQTFHAEPTVSHVGVKGLGPKLKPGMTFTIEPMINLGHFEVDLLEDDWTVVTRDGSLSAQFEHTVVVTAGGCEVLTKRYAVVKNSEDVPWADRGPLSCFLG